MPGGSSGDALTSLQRLESGQGDGDLAGWLAGYSIIIADKVLLFYTWPGFTLGCVMITLCPAPAPPTGPGEAGGGGLVIVC